MKGYSEELRARLEAYRTENRAVPMTMTELGKELGVSGTRVNKYLLLNRPGKEPEGDVAGLERLIEDLLSTLARRPVADLTPFSTNVVDSLTANIELIRRTNDVGLCCGPAGIGKTVTVGLYVLHNPTTLHVCVAHWANGERGLINAIWDQISHAGYNNRVSRGSYIAQHMINSNRLLLIDNAHRMTAPAIKYMFDFHDATGCPVALVGNPEVLDKIKGNDQQFSRIGVCLNIELSVKRCADYARHVVYQLVDEPQDGLVELATQVIVKRGHLRALRKELQLMNNMLPATEFKGDQIAAFRAAHKTLVREYSL